MKMKEMDVFILNLNLIVLDLLYVKKNLDFFLV